MTQLELLKMALGERHRLAVSLYGDTMVITRPGGLDALITHTSTGYQMSGQDIGPDVTAAAEHITTALQRTAR